MDYRRISVRVFGPAVLLSLSLGLSAKAAEAPDLSKIRIDNFGRINENYYRGAQPKGQDYAALASFGIKTVIDLQADFRADEEGLVQKAGMKFFRIPLTTSDRPSDAAVAKFLQLVNDPANQPVYVHCAGGKHRTGVMTAVYRMTHDSWTADHAYTEMASYHFETFLGHPTLKRFVYDYFGQMTGTRVADNQKVAATAASMAAVTATAGAR